MESLQCTICFESFDENKPDNNPYSLTCGHSFCLRCLNRIQKCIKKRNVWGCPQCKRISTKISKNYLCLNVISEMQQLNQNKCPQHQKSLDLLCLHCEKLICSQCMKDHKNHQIGDHETFKQEMSQKVTHLKTYIRRANDKFIQRVKNTKSTLVDSELKNYRERIQEMNLQVEDAEKEEEQILFQYDTIEQNLALHNFLSSEFDQQKEFIKKCFANFDVNNFSHLKIVRNMNVNNFMRSYNHYMQIDLTILFWNEVLEQYSINIDEAQAIKEVCTKLNLINKHKKEKFTEVIMSHTNLFSSQLITKYSTLKLIIENLQALLDQHPNTDYKKQQFSKINESISSLIDQSQAQNINSSDPFANMQQNHRIESQYDIQYCKPLSDVQGYRRVKQCSHKSGSVCVNKVEIAIQSILPILTMKGFFREDFYFSHRSQLYDRIYELAQVYWRTNTFKELTEKAEELILYIQQKYFYSEYETPSDFVRFLFEKIAEESGFLLNHFQISSNNEEFLSQPIIKLQNSNKTLKIIIDSMSKFSEKAITIPISHSTAQNFDLKALLKQLNFSQSYYFIPKLVRNDKLITYNEQILFQKNDFEVLLLTRVPNFVQTENSLVSILSFYENGANSEENLTFDRMIGLKQDNTIQNLSMAIFEKLYEGIQSEEESPLDTFARPQSYFEYERLLLEELPYQAYLALDSGELKPLLEIPSETKLIDLVEDEKTLKIKIMLNKDLLIENLEIFEEKSVKNIHLNQFEKMENLILKSFSKSPHNTTVGQCIEKNTNLDRELIFDISGLREGIELKLNEVLDLNFGKSKGNSDLNSIQGSYEVSALVFQDRNSNYTTIIRSPIDGLWYDISNSSLRIVGIESFSFKNPSLIFYRNKEMNSVSGTLSDQFSSTDVGVQEKIEEDFFSDNFFQKRFSQLDDIHEFDYFQTQKASKQENEFFSVFGDKFDYPAF